MPRQIFDQIFDVTYFDRQGAQEGGDRIYRHKEGLGVFTVSTSLLRFINVELPEIDGRSHSRRHAVAGEAKLYELDKECDERIKNVITYDFDN